MVMLVLQQVEALCGEDDGQKVISDEFRKQLSEQGMEVVGGEGLELVDALVEENGVRL
jgi:hypothetical protein